MVQAQRHIKELCRDMGWESNVGRGGWGGEIPLHLHLLQVVL